MSQSWKSYDRAADHGPLSVAIKAVIGITILVILIGGIAYTLGWFGEAAHVARDEYGPRATVRKYEWFKDTAQALRRQQADIKIQEAAIAQFRVDYGATTAQWPRDVRETYAQRQAELAGLKLMFNRTAAEYNANATKVNWSHVNVDGLPAEFTTYQIQ